MTSIPLNVWDFAMSDQLYTYQMPDPGTARRVFLIFEQYTVVTARHPNGIVRTMEGGTNVLPAKYLELGVRRIGGSLVAICLLLTIGLVGVAIKTIHLLGQHFVR
jgi:hypothetical protein